MVSVPRLATLDFAFSDSGSVDGHGCSNGSEESNVLLLG